MSDDDVSAAIGLLIVAAVIITLVPFSVVFLINLILFTTVIPYTFTGWLVGVLVLTVPVLVIYYLVSK